MKTRNLTLVIASSIIAAGCVGHVSQQTGDPQTRYIVRFDKPTTVVDRSSFIAALKKGSWRRNITFTPKNSTDPSANEDKNPISSALTETTVVSQNSTINPASQHVTQRVGFNAGQEADLKALLDLVKQ